MKKLIAIIVLACSLLVGCTTPPETPSYYDDVNSTNIVLQTEFNEEHYVWESFIFSTNRVDNINK